MLFGGTDIDPDSESTETIFSQGKTVDQVVGIARRLLEKDANIMATRADRPVYEALQSICDRIEYHEAARIVV